MEYLGLIGVVLGVGFLFGAGAYVGWEILKDVHDGIAWFTRALWRGYGFRGSVRAGWTALSSSFWKW